MSLLHSGQNRTDLKAAQHWAVVAYLTSDGAGIEGLKLPRRAARKETPATSAC
ncbi:hypothetical protein GCM10010246_06160 [Streptomyces cuspidosporus]|uniref:Uncharacterized protein n=1 Tax=Streptomyces cuspidosporus TaxID=66882 RepID=A0ABN3FCB8_9ACTN